MQVDVQALNSQVEEKKQKKAAEQELEQCVAWQFLPLSATTPVVCSSRPVQATKQLNNNNFQDCNIAVKITEHHAVRCHCRHCAEQASAHVDMLTMSQLNASAVRKGWDREVQDFRTTYQVREQLHVH